MGMAAAFLFMEDHHARLAFQTKPLFDLGNRALEHVQPDVFGIGRVERDGEQELLALGAHRHGLGFLHRAHDRLRYEAADFVNLDLFILGFQEVQAKLGGAAAR